VEYSFAVPAAGRYAVNLRIATPNKDAQLQIKKAEGTILSTLNIPTTGGWQTWQTITATVPLEKGLQSLRVQASATPAWNMNWLQLQGPN
jgi:endoglucanase